jgi:hypothetical protein
MREFRDLRERSGLAGKTYLSHRQWFTIRASLKTGKPSLKRFCAKFVELLLRQQGYWLLPAPPRRTT